MSLARERARIAKQLVNQFSGLFFIIWVILPTAAGFVCRLLLTPRASSQRSSWLTRHQRCRAAAVELHQLGAGAAEGSTKSTAGAACWSRLLLAVALGVVGLVLAWLIARLFRMRPETRAALMFGLSMKHTGLALILAGRFSTISRSRCCMIVLATLHAALAGRHRAMVDGSCAHAAEQLADSGPANRRRN